MKPEELFGVAVRTVGLIMVIYSAATLSAYLFAFGGSSFGNAGGVVIAYALTGLVVGLTFLLAPNGLVRVAYRQSQRT